MRELLGGAGRWCTDANPQPSFTPRRRGGRDESASLIPQPQVFGANSLTSSDRPTTLPITGSMPSPQPNRCFDYATLHIKSKHTTTHNSVSSRMTMVPMEMGKSVRPSATSPTRMIAERWRKGRRRHPTSANPKMSSAKWNNYTSSIRSTPRGGEVLQESNASVAADQTLLARCSSVGEGRPRFR
jgi:hypothetical protein